MNTTENFGSNSQYWSISQVPYSCMFGAQPHVSVGSQQKIQELRYELPLHWPYFRDLALAKYHKFWFGQVYEGYIINKYTKDLLMHQT